MNVSWPMISEAAGDTLLRYTSMIGPAAAPASVDTRLSGVSPAPVRVSTPNVTVAAVSIFCGRERTGFPVDPEPFVIEICEAVPVRVRAA